MTSSEPQQFTAANVIPPGSTAVREILHAIVNALALPTPATTKDELVYLRISRDRARELVIMARRVLRGPRDFSDEDLMAEIIMLRGKIGQLPPDAYVTNPLEF